MEFAAIPILGVMFRGLTVLSVLLLALQMASGQTLRAYPSKYYVIHSDLDPLVVREASLRITLMAEVYHERTRGFAGTIRERLPFYLFRDAKDYLAAGGLPGSMGSFTGDRLMAYIGPQTTAQAWHVIQHEGFHQFVSAVVGGDVPIWVNEGLAEYFGHGVFTGDGYVTGLVPPSRLKRLRGLIESGRLRPVKRMLQLTHENWNSELTGVNYDQAWSMVHFLAHGEGGRYQDRFVAFMKDVSHGKAADAAWTKRFGNDARAFEDAWRQYWLQLPEDPTADLYAKATVATLTSYLGRAFAQKQRFASFDEFISAAKAGELRMHGQDWLPEGLLKDALSAADQAGEWSLLGRSGRPPELLLRGVSGADWLGSFRVERGRVRSVSVKAAPAKP